jgi:hypothetical protein
MWTPPPLWLSPIVFSHIGQTGRGWWEPDGDVAQLKKLEVAARRDLRDEQPLSLTERHGYSDESCTRRVARDGRALWRQIGAWPWCCLPPGRLPDQWWREERVAEALLQWRNGKRGRATIPSPL